MRMYAVSVRFNLNHREWFRYVYNRATVSRADPPERGRELATGSVEEINGGASGPVSRPGLEDVQKVLIEPDRHQLARMRDEPALLAFSMRTRGSEGASGPVRR